MAGRGGANVITLVIPNAQFQFGASRFGGKVLKRLMRSEFRSAGRAEGDPQKVQGDVGLYTTKTVNG
jgi:hypothetical protein